jgi:hypothetical protein
MLDKGEGERCQGDRRRRAEQPGKLLGRNTSPSSAKIETASPPARKRNRYSISS